MKAVFLGENMVDNKKTSYYTNLIYFVVVVGLIVVRICANYGLFAFLGTYGSYILSLLTQVGLIFLLPFLLFKFLTKSKTKETFKNFNYRKVSLKTILLSVVLGMIVFVLNVYVSNFFNGVIEFFGYEPVAGSASTLPAAWWVLLLNLLCTAVLPAICEETLHRGMLLHGNSSLGFGKSLLLSGLMFGLLHLNIEQFFYATLIGLFLGYLCYCCCSIFPCMIVHFMNNAISVFLSFAQLKGWAIGNVFSVITEFLAQNVLLGIILFILVFILLLLVAEEIVKLLLKDNFNYNVGKQQKKFASMAIRESYFQQIDDIKNNVPMQNQIYNKEDNMIVMNFDEFFNFVEKNVDELFKKDEDNLKKETKNSSEADNKNIELKTKVFLYGSIVLMAVVTIMTFIWGLLR